MGRLGNTFHYKKSKGNRHMVDITNGKTETAEGFIDQDELEFPEIDMELDEVNEDDRQKEQDEQDEEENEQIELSQDEQGVDLSEFTPSVCEQLGRAFGEAGVLSIVNSKKNGKRVSLSRELMEQLANTETVQIGFTDQLIAISEYLGDQYTSYMLRKSGSKSIIYSSELVKQITEKYHLNFTNRTSFTFTEASYKSQGDKKIAFVNIRKPVGK